MHKSQLARLILSFAEERERYECSAFADFSLCQETFIMQQGDLSLARELSYHSFLTPYQPAHRGTEFECCPRLPGVGRATRLLADPGLNYF